MSDGAVDAASLCTRTAAPAELAHVGRRLHGATGQQVAGLAPVAHRKAVRDLLAPLVPLLPRHSLRPHPHDMPAPGAASVTQPQSRYSCPCQTARTLMENGAPQGQRPALPTTVPTSGLTPCVRNIDMCEPGARADQAYCTSKAAPRVPHSPRRSSWTPLPSTGCWRGAGPHQTRLSSAHTHTWCQHTNRQP